MESAFKTADIVPHTMNNLQLPLALPKIKPYITEACCAAYIGDTWLEHSKDFHSLDIRMLAFAIQEKFDVHVITRYLQAFPPDIVRATLSKPVSKMFGPPYYPILFFAIEQNSPALVRMLINAGADVEQPAQPWGLPLLIYTIISAEYELVDTTDTLGALLAMGADPDQVPAELFNNYLESPSRLAHKLSILPQDLSWCTKELLTALCRNLTLMQRYYLSKAKELDKPTPRMLQIARAFDILPLFETHYHIIGQSRSTQQILRTIISHYIYDADKPLVLLLTGMSGHGKTEIAKRMGDLLSLAFHRVDLTEMKHETDIFGPKKPYYGYEKGTLLNNYLAEHKGNRCVVFLDEFEKTTPTVRQSMLLLLESGFYKDRRTDELLDCTKVIWVLAANLGESRIQQFWTDHMKDRTPSQQADVPYEQLQRDLESQFTSHLGAPMTGRLSSVVPFLPFSEAEQAVTTYKFMRELWHLARSPIDIAKKKFARHSYLHFTNDSDIALHLAKKAYSPELGARSLEKAVNHDIRAKLAFKQLEDGEEFQNEMNDGPLPVFEVRLVGAKGGGGEEVIEITKTGVKEVLSKKIGKINQEAISDGGEDSSLTIVSAGEEL